MIHPEFTIMPLGTNIKQQCRLEPCEGGFYVYIENAYTGLLTIDDRAPFGYSATGVNLIPLVEEIAMKLKKYSFDKTIKKIWGLNILSAEWQDQGTIIAVVHPDTDLDEFGNVVLDVIYDYVDFKDSLVLLLNNRATSDEFKVVIN